MYPFPHRYSVTAEARSEGLVRLGSPGLPPLLSAPPAEFDGPGDLWSPETLMTAAIADCFALTFRAAAKVRRIAWIRLRCDAEGTVDRTDSGLRLTGVRLHVNLTVPPETPLDTAHKALERAEANCLVGNSLQCPLAFEASVQVEAEADAEAKIPAGAGVED